jgi:hypothetical protein
VAWPVLQCQHVVTEAVSLDTAPHLLYSLPNEESHVHPNGWLCGDPHAAVQKLWREIGAVLPYDGVELWVQLKCSKHIDIPQGLKNRTVELVTEVYFALETIAETETNDVIPYPFGFCNSAHHLLQG